VTSINPLPPSSARPNLLPPSSARPKVVTVTGAAGQLGYEAPLVALSPVDVCPGGQVTTFDGQHVVAAREKCSATLVTG
jgi:hypothetical protein